MVYIELRSKTFQKPTMRGPLYSLHRPLGTSIGLLQANPRLREICCLELVSLSWYRARAGSPAGSPTNAGGATDHPTVVCVRRPYLQDLKLEIYHTNCE